MKDSQARKPVTLRDINDEFSLVNSASMAPDADDAVEFFSGKFVPLEMHRATTVKRLYLRSIDKRAKAITGAGNNTFLLDNRDVFLDMLTDSGVNSMSIYQQSALQPLTTPTPGRPLSTACKTRLTLSLARSTFCLPIRVVPASTFWRAAL